nr:MAG TPA: hypothetical protein [Caudoviricetes sp.]
MLIISNHLLLHLLRPVFNPFAALRAALRRGVEMPVTFMDGRRLAVNLCVE